MSEHLRALLNQVLALPEGERLQLLGEVLESLRSAGDVEKSWTQEIKERVEELRSGKAELLDWDEARAAIQGSRQ